MSSEDEMEPLVQTRKDSTEEIKRRKISEGGHQHSLSLPFLTRPISVLNDPLTSGQDSVDEVQQHGIHFRYEDYSTIDFAHDIIKDRIRHRNLRNESWLAKCWDSSQAWIVLFVVGVSAGLIASFIDVVVPYFYGWREGYCRNGLYYVKSNCREWIDWNDSIGIKLGFVIYLLLSLGYALAAVLIVSNGPTHKLRDTRNITADMDREFLSQRTLYHAAGSGIPEVKTILGGFVIKRFLGLRTLIYKIIGLILAVSSGLCLGVQGPLVHISCCLGNISSRFFEKYERNDAKKREIMSAACAAGVSVAFGAPIGGVLFSLEETSYYFPPKTMWRSFFCCLIAATTVKYVNPLGTGKLVLFQVNYSSEYHSFEIFGFVSLGIIGGLMGSLFIKLSKSLRATISAIRIRYIAIYEVMLVALLTSILSYSTDLTMMNNLELVSELFMECQKGSDLKICKADMNPLISSLLGALLIKWLLMLLTFGIRVPGGLLLPNMLVGALFGRVAGEVTKNLLPLYNIIPGVYAMVGAASLVSGTHRMTVSLVVIMFELTGNLSYVLPLMTTVMVAKWVADGFGRNSVFDSVIEQKGYPYLNFKHQKMSKRMLLAEDLMDNTMETINCKMLYRFTDVEKILKDLDEAHPSGDGGFPVLKGGAFLTGYISQHDLIRALDNIKEPENAMITFSGSDQNILYPSPQVAESVTHDPILDSHVYCLSQFINKAPITISSLSSAELVVEIFMKLGIRTLLVLNEGTYAGIIHKKQLLSLLHKS